MTDHPYYKAARHADASVGKGGMVQWAAEQGVAVDALVHLAEQRAIRCILTLFMGYDPDSLDSPVGSPPRRVHIPSHLRELIPQIAATFIDGWACHLHTVEPPKHKFSVLVRDATEAECEELAEGLASPIDGAAAIEVNGHLVAVHDEYGTLVHPPNLSILRDGSGDQPDVYEHLVQHAMNVLERHDTPNDKTGV